MNILKRKNYGLNIYAVKTVEKKGKTPININEEIDNQKDEEEEKKEEEIKNEIKENVTDDGFVNIEKINKNEEIKKPVRALYMKEIYTFF